MSQLLQELKRRNVIRVALFYIVSAWVVVQVAETILPMFDVPEGALRALVLILALGFPLALVFAWVFELTPEGLKREKDVEVSPATKKQTVHKLNWATLVAAVLAIGLIVVDRLLPESAPMPGDDAPAEVAAGDSDGSGRGEIEKSIAVLPFSDFSPGGDSQWFADGLSEEILNSLVRVPDLLVAARTASFAFRDSERPIPEIASELGVAHLLEGSVRMGGDRVRVTAQLIRADDGFHVWSDNFDRETADMIGIQEEVAREIAEAMETTMDPAALAEMARVGTDSVEAYQAYIRGRASEEFGGNPDAYELFEEARRIDPGFSQAHFRAARFWMIQSEGSRTDLTDTGLDAEEMGDRFIERIDAAIETVASEQQRLVYRGLKARFQLRFRDALALFDAYLEKRPEDIEAWGQLMGLGGILREDAIVLRAIDALEPAAERNLVAATSLPAAAHRLSDPALAALQVERVIPLLGHFPQAGNFHYQLHRALLWVGRVDEAREIHDRIFRAGLETANPGLLRLRQACAEGRLEDARMILDTELSDQRTDQWLGQMTIGRAEQAYETLQALEDSGRTYALASYLIYPQFDATRFPSMMRVLDAEGLEPHPVRPIPFACQEAEPAVSFPVKATMRLPPA